MKLNKREEFMLWRLLEFIIFRYLLSLKRSGHERAEQHIAMSKVIWEVVNLQTATPADHDEIMKIHDLIADRLTGHLHRHIGFDADDEEHEWDIFAEKFFKELLLIMLSLQPSK